MAARPLPKRALAAAAGATLFAAASGWALGPGAAVLVDTLADGRRIWRLGTLELDGVSGTWLGDLSAERATLSDPEGVWAEAFNLSLHWRPLALISGDVRVDNAFASQVRILRRPVLTQSRRSERRLDVQIGSIRLADVFLAEPVAGVEADFAAGLSLEVDDRRLRFIDLTFDRTDADFDRARLFFNDREPYLLDAALSSAEGGVFARLLGVPESSVTASAEGNGDALNGGAAVDGRIGKTPFLNGALNWRETGWTLDTNANLDAFPGLASLAQRIGSPVSIAAAGARAGAFHAQAETPFLAVALDGQLGEDLALDGPARVVATTERLSDIAHEAPFSFGPARIEGELRYVNDVLGLRANATASELDVLGRRSTMSGPLEATLSDARFALTAELAAAADAPALFVNAHLRTEMEYDRDRSRYALTRATLDGDALAFDAQGWVNDGAGEFSGDWRVKQIGALIDGLGGVASGRWRAMADATGDDARVWRTSVDGAGEGVASQTALVGELLGPSPRFDGLFRSERGGVTVSHARLDGARMRAGATGRIVAGETDLALELSARGPISLGGAQIDGAADATGAVSGPLARPSLHATAHLASFSSGSVVVDAPRLTLALAPEGSRYRGDVAADGRVAGQAFTGNAQIAITAATVELSSIAARAGALHASGDAAIAPAGVNVDLAISGAIDGLLPGATGAVTGRLALTPATLALNAELANASVGMLRVRAAHVQASGPHQEIAARFALSGALRRAPLTFSGTARANLERGVEIAAEGQGALAGINIVTRTPMTLSSSDNGLNGALDVALGDGGLSGTWRERGRVLSGSAVLEGAPLAPLAAIWGERATGAITGAVSLANAGRGLTGESDLTLSGVRFPGRQRGALDLRVVGALAPDRLRAEIDARSTDGLTARFEADAPVTTSAAPLRIASARDRRGRATWRLDGPADALWALTRLPDQALSGRLQGQGELSFGAGHLSGDGQIEIIDGRFEDKNTGVELVALNALTTISERGVTIERFTAAGARGGQLSATGGSLDARRGRITVAIDDMWLADRPDGRARGGGELTLAWEGLQTTVSGALSLTEAELDIAQSPNAGIPSLEVIEINRPDDFAMPEPERAPSARAQATAIDVRVRAPGRVFTRGRGVDAEWSLDLRLDGSAAAPNVFGEAEIVRGRLALSGQPFEIARGRLRFNGDPLAAQVDVLAERVTGDLTARIAISGEAASPEITLSSDPALPEDEILPQVLFGRSVEDLSPFEAAQIAAALANLSGRASFDLVNVARAAAGLDRFNVRQDENGGVLVAGGVYLTRDVYVEVARSGLGEAQSSVEWTIRPRLVLITSFLGNNDQRVSLRWRRESD